MMLNNHPTHPARPHDNHLSCAFRVHSQMVSKSRRLEDAQASTAVDLSSLGVQKNQGLVTARPYQIAAASLFLQVLFANISSLDKACTTICVCAFSNSHHQRRGDKPLVLRQMEEVLSQTILAGSRKPLTFISSCYIALSDKERPIFPLLSVFL